MTKVEDDEVRASPRFTRKFVWERLDKGHSRSVGATTRPGRHRRSARLPISQVGTVESAAPRSTAVWYSNAIVFHRSFVPSSAQIAAQTALADRPAPSSQRGGQGFEPPCSAP